ncbi:MAG: toll/interleukin-1 receptor domain-containing protein [Cyanobacteria bacterium P01_G01_bin.39]
MKVFISYAHTDTKLARLVAGALRKADFQVWDDTQVLPGENLAKSISQALDESDAIVVLLTPNSVHSPNIAYDVGYALGKQEYKGRLIPVLAAPSEQFEPDEIPWIFNLQQFQMIRIPNLEENEEGLKKIAQALKQVA